MLSAHKPKALQRVPPWREQIDYDGLIAIPGSHENLNACPEGSSICVCWLEIYIYIYICLFPVVVSMVIEIRPLTTRDDP